MLQTLDMFGIPIQLRFNKMQSHKTIFGGLVTLIVILLITLYSYSILSQCIQFQKPNVVFQENLITSPDDMIFDQNQYTLALGIQDQNFVHFIDESIYYLDVQLLDTSQVLNQSTNQYEQVTNSQHIQMEPCTLNHFQVSGTQQQFQNLQYTNLYCFPLNFQIKLGGQYGAIDYKRLQIQVKSCLANCKDTSVIQQKLSSVALGLYYVNYIIQPNDSNNPFQPIVQSSLWRSEYSVLKNVSTYFRKTTVSSDYGLITESLTHDIRMIYSYDRETQTAKTDNTFYQMFISLEQNKQSEYFRTYLKLQSGFSLIGGIFNVLFLLGFILCIPIQKVSLEYKMVSYFFQFQKKREESKCQLQIRSEQNPSSRQTLNQQLFSGTMQPKLANQDWNNLDIEYTMQTPALEISKRKKKPNLPYINRNEVKRKNQLDSAAESINQTQNNFYFSSQHEKFLMNNTNISGLQYTNINFNQNQSQIQQQQLQEKSYQQTEYVIGIQRVKEVFTNAYKAFNSIKFSFYGLVKSKLQNSLNFNKPFSKMINYGVEKLYDQLDISFILAKLIEIEKLKYLLLNENQIKLFEFISKPTLYLQDFENENQKRQVKTDKDSQPNMPQNTATEKLNNKRAQFERFSLLKSTTQNEEQKAREAEEAFNQIYKIEKSQSVIDKRLIRLLDMEFFVDLEMSQPIKSSNSNIQSNQQTTQLVDTMFNTNNNAQKENILSNGIKSNQDILFTKQRLSDQNDVKIELESSPQKQEFKKIPSIPNHIILKTNDENI
ncbi:transmembrane protein, putative (macronuclear) [Tetrahymena thermophila SB210]|uniref:Transmembrane protein, putative n=1 Tax=Tetrahymena thermophila (strain SB210) TaxID=312017 RepID=I7MFV0_TETTS|nr:transmembrane protein, putative [Tetrahymena thermophila SB210]EAS00622.2 transmembrane protein, putative [Tetrahymena thermophila SB210]|eukprot:XP_001020867.2 transmembrane protein, putative [Tetrahymena thermophila SB210]